MSKIKDATKLVDIAFNEGFEIFGKMIKAEKHLQKIMDTMDLGTGNLDTTGRPYDHPSKVRVSTTIKEFDSVDPEFPEDEDEYDIPDENGDEFNGTNFDAEYEEGPETADDPDMVTNDINHVPNQDADSLYISIVRQLGEIRRLNEDAKEEYKAFFDKMLNQYGVNSPAELDAEKKKEFFDKVDAAWQAKKEED